jgi:hypothetical protein
MAASNRSVVCPNSASRSISAIPAQSVLITTPGETTLTRIGARARVNIYRYADANRHRPAGARLMPGDAGGKT